jgi:outer membrane lipoprotein-sorting protein
MRKFVGVLSVLGLLALVIPVRADDDAKLREVIAKAIKAHGGEDNLTKYKGSAAKSKGKFYALGEGQDYTGEFSIQLPNRIRTEVQFKIGDQDVMFLQIVDGNKGWRKIVDKTDELGKDEIDEAKEQMNAANIAHLICLKDKEYKLSPLGEVKVGDRPAIGIRVERKGYRDVSLFFDKDKYLLLQMETRGKDFQRGGEEYTATNRYDDYKEVEGMMVAHKVTIKHDGKLFVEGESTDVKLSEKLDDSLFEKP